ncbi:unnamed protein product [Caenorhabditis sp. 36 PRJEB53466]|nr:unnamed protein product [Caenorhabditis sp. 36 PRJEB53466]
MKGIGFFFLLQIVLIEAVQGSSEFLSSTISLVGIGAFTLLLGALLVYACLADVKHWRKSIDGRAQLAFPTAELAEFQLPPIHDYAENLVTPLEPDTTKKTETTQMERTQNEKTLRIVRAMYTSSNRDVPEAVQHSLQSKGPNRFAKASTVLSTISETNSEKEEQSSKRSPESQSRK